MRENNGEESGLTQKQVAGWIEEDQEERKRFDERVKEVGGPLKYIREALQIWSLTSPQQGTYAKMCAIMANELGKTMAGIEGNTRHPDPVKDELVEALGHLLEICEDYSGTSENEHRIHQAELLLSKVQAFRINERAD